MHGERPSVAKITRPVPTGCYARKRLFKALDRGSKRPILWISGPPGSGKTILVSSYVAATKLPCIWYLVDPRDGDVATCFYYLGLAARKAAPRIRKPLPLLTPEYLPGLPAFTKRFFEALFSRLASPGVIVFDDCHGVPADSPFHVVLQEGLSLLPAGIRAILISRGPAPAVLSRFLANREMEEFGSDDLRFTPVETKGMVDHSGYGSLDRESLRDLQEKTGGWAAGIAILMSERHRGKELPAPRTLGTPQAIFDYFASETFAKVDPEIRDFLLKSAFLPRTTAEMAEKLTGQGKAGRILTYLHRHHCFTEVLSDAGKVYRYHHLFREFLLARAKEELAGDEFLRLRRTAAAVLAGSGYWEEAIEPMRQSGDWEGLARVVLSQAPSLAAQGRYRTLEEWLRALPAKMLDDVPWTRYWLGVCRMMFDPEEGTGHFRDAFHAFRKRSDPAGVFLAWSGVVESIIFGLRDLGRLDPWIDLLDGLLAEYGGLPPGVVEGRVTCATIKALALRRPSYPAAEAWAGRCLTIARASDDVNMKAEALNGLALFRFHTGSYAGGAEATGVLQGLLKHRDISPLAVLMASKMKSVHANLTARHDRALEVVSGGLRLAESSGIHLCDYLLMGEGVLASLHLGDPATANRYLETMAARLAAAPPFDADFYHFVAGWEALHRGDRIQASFHAGVSLKMGEGTGIPVVHALGLLLGAHVFEEAGDRSRAGELLEKAHRLGIEHRLGLVVFVCLLTKGFFSLREGDGSSAEAALREGMRLGREKGYSGFYMVWRPEFMARVAAKALEAGIEVPYVRELIRKNRLVPEPSSVDLENWPWPVKVYTFGRFSLVVDGKVLPPARKAGQKPLLLLKSLIALGGREVPEEQLTEILWPEADGDLAHQSLATTLKRLRKRLGDDRSVLLHDGRLTLSNRHCWVDAWEFERTLGRADASRKVGATPDESGEAARLAERAIALYRGTFLSGETFSSRIVTQRERLRSKFLRAVERAGRHWERAGDWEKAIACNRKGLEVDPLSEEMYRGLISCHMRMGRSSEAHAVYRQCCRTLSAELGVTPSSDLEAILKSVPAGSGSAQR